MTRSTLAWIALCLAGCSLASAAERPVDPTFLYRQLGQDAVVVDDDLTAPGVRYRPLFGQGDANADAAKVFTRYGELEIDAAAKSSTVSYEAEEQIYYVLAGSGVAWYRGRPTPIESGDFMYFAPGAEHAAANDSDQLLRLIVMGFRVPADVEYGAPLLLPIANVRDAELQVVGNHPPSTLYRLLLGGVESRRDILAVGHSVTSLFTMEFAPGGTNHPHHHPLDEEVYLILEGGGEMVAGGGRDGIEGRRPARPGDAYFYRRNATVGFYADPKPPTDRPAVILAVRARVSAR